MLCVSQRVHLKWGQKVCKSGSAVTLRHHEGKFSGLTNTVQRLTSMSHISEILKVSIISSDEGKRRPHQTFDKI